MKACAKANTNIALIKYWGKRDEKLFLPTNSSLSITLDKFYTTTTVEFNSAYNEDIIYINDKMGNTADINKVGRFLDKVRKLADVNYYAKVDSYNTVPTAAGFASSASAFAALAASATRALNLNLTVDKLSILARQGSGSACRSVFGGFVEWNMGIEADGSDSYGRQILGEKEWDLTILSAVVTTGRKKVSSRDGMKVTVETSPFYKGWLESAASEIEEAKRAISERDFTSLGQVMERNALKMHATMLGANPPILYWESGTIDIIRCIEELRTSGIPAYFTIDAGPNVKVLCLPSNEEVIKKALMELPSVSEVHTCHPGAGISYLE